MGNFRIGALSLHLGRRAAVLTIVPSALRTAIAYAFGVRIITPSITAWPPTIKSLSLVLNSLPVGQASCLSGFKRETDKNVCPTTNNNASGFGSRWCSGNTRSDRRVSRRRRNTCYLLVSIQDHLSCYYLLALFHCAAGVSAGVSVACFLP